MSKLENLESLQPICLVATGRSGSEYLQSLLDGHPEIITFNTNIRFFTEYLPTTVTWKNSETVTSDFIDEFIGNNINKLVTKYHWEEGQDKLGENRNQSLKINTDQFKKNFIRIMDNLDVKPASVLLGIYGAYHLCLGRELSKTKVLFHHAHTLAEAKKFKEHFPNAKLITTVRDPRSAIVSINRIGRNSKLSEWDNYRHFYLSLSMPFYEDKASNSFFSSSLNTDIPFGPKKNESLINFIDKNNLCIRLEDIPKKEILYSLADHLGVQYVPSLLVSTWGGLEWWGDSYSNSRKRPRGWSENRTDNGWRKELSTIDLFILNNTLHDILLKHEYEVKNISFITQFLTILLIFLPMKYEFRYLNLVTVMKKLLFGSVREKLHAISFPFFYIKVCILLLYFLHAQITGIWKNWPSTILREKP